MKVYIFSLLFLLSAPAFSEETKSGYEKWQSMPEDERKQLKEKYHEFQQLSPEEQQKIRDRHKKLKALPPEKQQVIHERFDKFKQLSPEERKRRIEVLKQKRIERKTNK